MPPINLYNATTTYTNVPSSATAVDLSVENGKRQGLYIVNASTANLFLAVDNNASTTNYAFKLLPGGVYEMPPSYFTDRVSGIWDAVNGAALVTEISGVHYSN